MTIKLKLGHKIVLFWLITLVIAMVLVGVVFIWMDQSRKETEAYAGMSRGYSYIQAEIGKNINEIRSATGILAARKELISSINLISSYEDKEDYSAIIFDVEKEKILTQISRFAESSKLDVVSIFDAEGALVAYRFRNSNKSIFEGYVTYQDGQSKIVEKVSLPHDPFTIASLPQNVKKFVNFSGESSFRESSSHSKDGIYLERIDTLGKAVEGNSTTIVGYIKTGRTLGSGFVAKIGWDVGYKFGLIIPGAVMFGQLKDFNLSKNGMDFPELIGEANTTYLQTRGELVTTEGLFESDVYFGLGRSLVSDDGPPAVLIFGIEKKSFRAAVATFRNASILVLVAVTLLMIPFAIYFIGRNISAPVAAMVFGFEALKKGEFVVLEETGRYDELAGLISSFNTMSETLRDSSRELRLLSMGVEQSSSVVMITNTEGDIQYVNPKFEEITGYDQTFVIGQNPRILKSDHTTKQEYEFLWDSLHDGIAWTGMLYNRKRDGSFYWEQSSIFPIKDENGLIEGYMKVGEDVSSRREADEKIQELNETLEIRVEERTKELATSQTFTEQLLTSAGEGIYGLDAVGRTTFVNPSACKILGYSADELIGKKMHDVIQHSYANGTPFPQSESPVFKGTSDGVTKRVGNHIFWKKDRSQIPVQLTSTPIYQDNLLRGRVVTFNDVTKLKEHEQELERSNAELQHFAYVAAHDLQEPLRKIQAFSERLENKFVDALGDQGKAYIERIVSSSTRMRSLIDDLLDYSRVRSKARPFAQTDLNIPLSEAIDDLETSINQAGAEVNVEILPTIDADKIQIRQVFQNIISNAIKFRREDAPLKINISGSLIGGGSSGYAENSMCRILVEDTGIGFDPKFREKIFGIFERLHGRSEYSGTGIGLATCRVVVERHGGRLTADSQLGAGATFEIILPVKHS